MWFWGLTCDFAGVFEALKSKDNSFVDSASPSCVQIMDVREVIRAFLWWFGGEFLAEAQADGTFCSCGVDDFVVLGDDDLFLGDETAGGGSGWLHEGLPVAAFLFCFGACVSGD
jgi:hypothetical protein